MPASSFMNAVSVGPCCAPNPEIVVSIAPTVACPARQFKAAIAAAGKTLRMGITETINTAMRRIPAWPLYILGVLPAIWLVWLGATGGLGAEPIKALEQGLGKKALQLLVLVLAITPLRRFAGLNLLKFRRAIGLLVFIYVTLHLLVWLVLDVQAPGRIWADILKRPYITVGMTAFLLLIPLAITSNNRSLRKLGPVRWRKLHKLVFPAAISGGVHYLMLVKGWQIKPVIYLAVILLLVATRFIKRRRSVANG